jgi:hypothetical protein
MVLDPVKMALRLRAKMLLPESSYIEIGRYSDIVFRRVSYFVIKEIVVVIVVVSIIINFL